MSRQLDTHAKAWKASLGDANRANLDRFLARSPAWGHQVSEAALRAGGAPIRELAGSFVFDLAEATQTDAAMSARLSTLRDRADTARALAYRMEVREGVVLRMRMILESVASREYLTREGTREEPAYEGLLACEALDLFLAEPVPGLRPADRSPFPKLEADLAAARDVIPAWIGIRFSVAPPAVRTAHGLAPGAASITAVYPDSRAQDAGLQVGDVV